MTLNGQQKYSDEQYLDGGYFSSSEDETHYTIRLVQKTRKPHQCSSLYRDAHELPTGVKALHETAILSDNGRVSNYLCLPCADMWLDEKED
jgi:hypothetical protein